MRNQMIIGAVALLLSGCGSDSSSGDGGAEVDPSVTLDQANSIVLTVDAAERESLTVRFSLADEDGLAITDAGHNLEIVYLGFPGDYDSSFAIPWHRAQQYLCGDNGSGCVGELKELQPGSYRFSPSIELEPEQMMPHLKFKIQVNGALASNPPELFDFPDQ
ncbi:hypothetical protein SAMN04488540_101449 [Ferrimonas sediminum]|uniref:Lipoprotein n=1 Tax=Ferrimonas sediminum TaxID=718193 RepID=A0A1G8KQ56_9GAMM|nr:hypothetical protein [Ferrimonas sediminum]SDI45558.1 hypothetical protein SAMN04488540_101449 [Ferrimonas sediminum]